MSLKGRALGERSGRACDGAGRRRRHGGVPHWRGARLEKSQEDAARRSGHDGHRRWGGSKSGIGNGAAARAFQGLRHSERQRRRTSRGAASTFASASAPPARHRHPDRRRRHAGCVGRLERRSRQRLDPGAVRGSSAPSLHTTAASTRSSRRRRPASPSSSCRSTNGTPDAERTPRTLARSDYVKVFMVAWMDSELAGRHGWRQRQRRRLTAADEITLLIRQRPDPCGSVRSGRSTIRHLITATVKGTIPLRANFGEWGLGDHLTMPDDWGKWALRRRALVAASITRTARVVTNWDIHDDIATSPETHVVSPQCDAGDEPARARPTRSTTAADQHGSGSRRSFRTFGDATGGFSTVFGTLSRPGHSDRPVRSAVPARHDALRRQRRRG